MSDEPARLIESTPRQVSTQRTRWVLLSVGLVVFVVVCLNTLHNVQHSDETPDRDRAQTSSITTSATDEPTTVTADVAPPDGAAVTREHVEQLGQQLLFGEGKERGEALRALIALGPDAEPAVEQIATCLRQILETNRGGFRSAKKLWDLLETIGRGARTELAKYAHGHFPAPSMPRPEDVRSALRKAGGLADAEVIGFLEQADESMCHCVSLILMRETHGTLDAKTRKTLWQIAESRHLQSNDLNSFRALDVLRARDALTSQDIPALTRLLESSDRTLRDRAKRGLKQLAKLRTK